jgi:hypothetical protein
VPDRAPAHVPAAAAADAHPHREATGYVDRLTPGAKPHRLMPQPWGIPRFIVAQAVMSATKRSAPSAGPAELLPALLKALAVGAGMPRLGYQEGNPVHLLQPMQEHRPIALAAHIGADLDFEVVGVDADEILVERRMVNLA